MITFSHPVSKYGLGVLLYKNNISSVEELKTPMIVDELKEGLRHYRLFSSNDPSLSQELVYSYLGLEDYQKDERLIQSAGLSNSGKYLAPNIITEEKSAKHTFNGVLNLIEKLERGEAWTKTEGFTMSISPLTGKINNGKTSQSNPSGSLFEVACSAITATTPLKPCFSLDGENVCAIPDLPIENLLQFIRFYQKMLQAWIERLLLGKAKEGKFSRPLIVKGNYPDVPYNTIFGGVGILAAIGKWSKEAGYDGQGEKVLESLKGQPIYIVKYGDAEVATYSHYLIEIAKENKLRKIVSSLEQSILVNEEVKRFDNPKYKLFFLFASRFLQLFNESSFKDFLAQRAFYEPEVIHLFNTYFINVMAISKEIVTSAREMGRWLNYVAYLAAKQNEKENASYEQIKKAKAKFLVELESTAFSAKTPEALLSQVITRAGRLSQLDAPPEAKDYLEATANGTITLEQAQHLMTAFSRLRNVYEKAETPTFIESQSAEI